MVFRWFKYTLVSLPVVLLGIWMSASSGALIRQEAGLTSGWSVPSFWLGTLLSCAGLCSTPLALLAAAHRDLEARVKALEAKPGSEGGPDAS